MKFKLLTKELYTDDGLLIKKMNCPLKIALDNLEIVSNNSKAKLCSLCNKHIIDTAEYSDENLFDILQKKPDTCLVINYNQKNIQII